MHCQYTSESCLTVDSQLVPIEVRHCNQTPIKGNIVIRFQCWWFALVVTSLVTSTKLLYVESG